MYRADVTADNVEHVERPPTVTEAQASRPQPRCVSYDDQGACTFCLSTECHQQLPGIRLTLAL
jgi:hypothetical protein